MCCVAFTTLYCKASYIATRLAFCYPIGKPYMSQLRNTPRFGFTTAMRTAVFAVTCLFTLGFATRCLRLRPIGPVMAKLRDAFRFRIVTATTVGCTYTILAITSFFAFHLATGVSGRYPFAIAVAKRLYIPILHVTGIAQALSYIFAFGVTAGISESIPRIGPNATQRRNVSRFRFTVTTSFGHSSPVSESERTMPRLAALCRTEPGDCQCCKTHCAGDDAVRADRLKSDGLCPQNIQIGFSNDIGPSLPQKDNKKARLAKGRGGPFGWREQNGFHLNHNLMIGSLQTLVLCTKKQKFMHRVVSRSRKAVSSFAGDPRQNS